MTYHFKRSYFLFCFEKSKKKVETKKSTSCFCIFDSDTPNNRIYKKKEEENKDVLLSSTVNTVDSKISTTN